MLDFVGVFGRLEKALAFDSDEVDCVIEDIDLLKQRFADLMRDNAPEYLALCRGVNDDKLVERALDALSEKARREAFVDLFKELQEHYEIISPDKFMRAYEEDYGRLAWLYTLVPETRGQPYIGTEDLAKKTAGMGDVRLQGSPDPGWPGREDERLT